MSLPSFVILVALIIVAAYSLSSRYRIVSIIVYYSLVIIAKLINLDTLNLLSSSIFYSFKLSFYIVRYILYFISFYIYFSVALSYRYINNLLHTNLVE